VKKLIFNFYGTKFYYSNPTTTTKQTKFSRQKLPAFQTKIEYKGKLR